MIPRVKPYIVEAYYNYIIDYGGKPALIVNVNENSNDFIKLAAETLKKKRSEAAKEAESTGNTAEVSPSGEITKIFLEVPHTEDNPWQMEVFPDAIEFSMELEDRISYFEIPMEDIEGVYDYRFNCELPVTEEHEIYNHVPGMKEELERQIEVKRRRASFKVVK